MRAVLFVLLGLLITPKVYCQNNPLIRQLSARDSALVKKYTDSAWEGSIFSIRRQHYLDSALRIAPWMAGWWQQKAMPLFKQKKYEIGMPFLDSAVKYNVTKYLDYRAFMKCIYQKSYRAAIADFQLAKAIAPNDVVMDHRYDFYLGLCHLQLNQFDSAELFLTRTINEQKKSIGDKWVNPLDLFYLGIVYYEQEDYYKAEEVFDQCLKVYTNFSDAKYYKAGCLYRTGRHEAAKLLLQEAGHDFQQGYTITDINAIHEAYPYQVNARSFSKT